MWMRVVVEDKEKEPISLFAKQWKSVTNVYMAFPLQLYVVDSSSIRFALGCEKKDCQI